MSDSYKIKVIYDTFLRLSKFADRLEFETTSFIKILVIYKMKLLFDERGSFKVVELDDITTIAEIIKVIAELKDQEFIYTASKDNGRAVYHFTKYGSIYLDTIIKDRCTVEQFINLIKTIEKIFIPQITTSLHALTVSHILLLLYLRIIADEENNSPITNISIAEQFNISVASAGKYLNLLVKKEYLTSKGKYVKKTKKYIFTPTQKLISNIDSFLLKEIE